MTAYSALVNVYIAFHSGLGIPESHWGLSVFTHRATLYSSLVFYSPFLLLVKGYLFLILVVFSALLFGYIMCNLKIPNTLQKYTISFCFKVLSHFHSLLVIQLHVW